jgi:hypothetical protein
MALSFNEGDSNTVTKTLTIGNDGGGVMVWAARKTAPWLWMNGADGALETGYTKDVEVFFSASGLTAGTYTDTISVEGVSAGNSPQTVKVTVTVKAVAAVTGDASNAVARAPTPAPPWQYNEYSNDTYNFRLRYPKNYDVKQFTGAAFGAVAGGGKDDSDDILLQISGSYGVDYKSVAEEWAKTAMRAAGAARLNIRTLSDDKTTLADGSTPAYELTYESKSSGTSSFQSYVFGAQKGSRFIFFAGCATLPTATGKMDLWKQIGHTLEFLD